MPKFNIAIDGPSGAGKSTIARALAAHLGCTYVDTGALYRAIGLHVARGGGDAKRREDVLAALPSAEISTEYTDGAQRVLLGGEDVSELIRTPAASLAASDVSKHPEVRAALLDMQRRIAEERSVVMDGRDIGTVVLPQAEVKIFLTASAEDRARRRYEELLARGEAVSFDEVLRDIRLRDKNDSEREIAPLRPAEDSIRTDTTGCTLEEGIARVIKTAEAALRAAGHM